MRKGIVFYILIVTNLLAQPCYALEDDLKKAIGVATYGGRFQAERLKVAAENLANEDTTSVRPGGDPYRRKIVLVDNIYNKSMKTKVVRTKKVDFDKSDFIVKYDPGHPAANEEGYVKYPNVYKEIERADASEAQRGYEANLGVIEISNSLIHKTIDAMK